MNLFAAGRRLTWVLIGLWLAVMLIALAMDGFPRPMNAVLVVAGVSLVIYGISWCIGWIVRGAMGIETGKDR